jgi:MFS family permease
VDDCFFLHERGAKIGYYTASLCLAGLAPVAAGYMLDSGTWRLLYYILAGLAGGLFTLGFFFVVETRFDRSEGLPLETLEEYAEDHHKLDHHVTHVQSYEVPARKSYLRQLNPWSGANPKASFWISLARSFTYLAYPAVLPTKSLLMTGTLDHCRLWYFHWYWSPIHLVFLPNSNHCTSL